MRLDPKTFTLNIKQRCTIRRALQDQAHQQSLKMMQADNSTDRFNHESQRKELIALQEIFKE